MRKVREALDRIRDLDRNEAMPFIDTGVSSLRSLQLVAARL